MIIFISPVHLLELTANKASFHKVTFRPRGLTVICGKKKVPESHDRNKTFNGVGKSLLLNIINFCLGSNSIPEFKDKLAGWEFQLKFEVQGKTYVVRRKTDHPKILLNGEEMTIKDFCKTLGGLVFRIPEEATFLSFRTLISRFLRVKKEAYTAWDTIIPEEKAYQKLVNAAFLLGIDILQIQKKYILKQEFDEVIESKKRIENDEIFKEYFSEGKNIDFEITNLEEKITNLKRSLNGFKIAEDYFEVKREADKIAIEKESLENKSFFLEKRIEQINASLKIRPDVSKDTVVDMYEKANVTLPGSFVKSLDTVLEFHKKIIEGRVKRLTTEKSRLQEQLSKINKQRKNLSQKLDTKMQYIGEHGALEEYTTLSNTLSQNRSSLNKLQGYKELVKKYDARIAELKIEIDQQNKIAMEYLDDIEPILQKNKSFFRDISRKFYPENAGGIAIKENIGDNQTQFNIDVKIDSDVSDGIGAVKIFCFDILILLLKNNHDVNFIFHDSRLFSDIDPRQVATLLQIIIDLSKVHDIQYIISLNEDVLNSAKKEMDQEYADLLDNTIVLELTDDSPESKLLGIHIDMDYEK